MTIKTLLIKFQNKISASEIPLFRGAVINSLDEKLVLFHNHVNDKLRYAYPLILSMCKGLGIYLDQKVETVITSLSPPKEVRFKNVPVISFDVTFHTNTYLPDNIGIGKHVSVGFGTIKNQNEKQL